MIRIVILAAAVAAVLALIAVGALAFPTWNSGGGAAQFAVVDSRGMTFVNQPSANPAFVVPQGGYVAK